MSADTVWPTHRVNKLILMETSEFGHNVESWIISHGNMLKVVKINSTYPQFTNSVKFSWNLPDMIIRPSWTNTSNSFFKFKTVMQRLTHLFSFVWRWYKARFMKIGQNLCPVDMYYSFWQLSTWRPNSDVSMRNNLLATWIGLTVSPDIDNKFEIYSCEERGVKTHLH